MYLFASLALVALAACDGSSSADDPSIDLSAELTDNVYYVAGNLDNTVVFQDDGTAEAGVYLFISKNLKDTVGVYNLTKDGLPGKLFDGIFEFPTEIMASFSGCGFFLFPEEYRHAYSVKINSYRPMKEGKSLGAPCLFMGPTSSIQTNKSIVVESLSKIE